MFYRRVPIFIALLLFLAPLTALAQTPAQPGDQTLKIGAKEVLLDVIARDKKGRNVRDLKPEEIEIYEDGVRQTINSFRLLETTATTPATNDSKAASINYPIDPARPVNLVTMVFDKLDNNSRRLAREAALDFVANGMRPNVVVAVYTIGTHFRVLQSFTSNKEKVRQAIEIAANKPEVQYESVSNQIVEQLEVIANGADFGPPPGTPGQSVPTGGVPQGPSGALSSDGLARGGSPIEKQMARMTLDTLRAVEAAMMDQAARASVYTLLHIAREQRRLAGRKSLLYFSTGLIVPPSLLGVMRAAMSEANRANLSIYAIDARGLSMETESDSVRNEMARAIAGSMEAQTSDTVSASGFMSADFVENSLRLNKEGTLAELAVGTGGTIIANTNELRKPLRQVADDLSSYYAISYTPTSEILDGKFRKITAKVARADIKLQSRSGYFAVPAVDNKIVLPHEVPALVAINAASPKHDFAHQIQLLRFVPGAEAQHLLLLRVPLATFAFKEIPVKKLYTAHFSFMAIFKNEVGKVVQRISEDYPLQGKLERLASLKNGNFDLSLPLALAPGRYTLQTVVHDFEADKTSVQSQAFVVPAANPKLALSSLVPIRRIEAAGVTKPSDDKPLLTAQGRIVPNLGEGINAATEKIAGFYLVAYTSAPDPAQLALEISQSDQIIVQTTMDLPAPDDKGRIAYIFSVPTTSFASGTYQVKAIVKQGNLQTEDRAQFTLTNPNPTKQNNAPAAQAMPMPAAVAKATATPATPALVPTVPVISTVGMSPAVLTVTKSMAGNASNDAAAVNIPELLSEVEKNGVALYQQLLGYTYQLRKVHHTLDEAGEPTKEEFQDFEAYPVRGRHVLIKIAEGGKKLSEGEIEQERKQAGSELERAETDQATALKSYLTAAISGSYRGKYAGLLIDPTAFLQACNFLDPRLQTLNGREMIVLDFVPRLGEKLPLTKSYVTRLTGTMWIDAIDKVIVRLEAKNVIPGVDKNGAPLRVSPEPKLVYQQTKQPSGEWFPSAIRMNADGDASALFGLNWDVVFEFKEYKQFNTGSEKEKIITPTEKKPE